MSTAYEIPTKVLKITTGCCDGCGDENVGTLDVVESERSFLCANCDRDAFETASEAQKAAYLAGDPAYSC
jgi:hypothetical protein